MKFYSREEFKKLNENQEVRDFYIEVAEESANSANDLISDDSSITYVLDGTNFFTFADKESANNALRIFNENEIEITDSNLEGQNSEDNNDDYLNESILNEAFQSTILASFEKLFKNKKSYTNVYKTLANMGVDLSRLTDEDIKIVSPEEVFKTYKNDNNKITILVNDDPLFKQILDSNKMSYIANTNNEIVIGIFRGDASVNTNFKPSDKQHYGIADRLADKWWKDNNAKLFTQYLTAKSNTKFSKMFGDNKEITFSGSLNKGNILALATKGYVIDLQLKTNSKLKGTRRDARDGALALKKYEIVRRENIDRYKTILANNVNFSSKSQELFAQLDESIKIVYSLEGADSRVYYKLNDLINQFYYTFKYITEYYSNMSIVTRSKKSNRSPESIDSEVKYYKDNAERNKRDFVNEYKKFKEYKIDLYKLIDEFNNSQNKPG